MNTNTTLPIISFHPDTDGRQSWLDFRWTDGVAHMQSLGLQLNLDAHEGGQEGIVSNLQALVAHIYLMGVELGMEPSMHEEEPRFQSDQDWDGIVADRDATITDLRAAIGRHELAHEALVAQRNELTARLQSDDRSMHTMCDADITRLGGAVDQLTLNCAARDERIAVLEAANVELQRQLTERTDERDAMSDTVEQLNNDEPFEHSALDMPTVMEVSTDNAVTIYRTGSNFNVQHWGIHGDADALAANLRGALADAFHAGRREGELGMGQAYAEMVGIYELGYSEGMVEPTRDNDPDDMRSFIYYKGREARRGNNDDAVRIEALIGAERQVREQMTESNRNWQARWDRMLVEVERLSAMLLEQAERRSWCADYEDFTRQVNRVNHVVVLTPRHKTYTVWFDVDAEPSRTQRELNQIGAVYNVEVEQYMQFKVSATVQCHPDELDQHIDQLRDELNSCSDVTDVNHQDTEEDES